MPFVYGFLRRARRPSRPGGGGPVDPDYGIDEGDLPEISPPEEEDDPEVGGGPILPSRPWPKPPIPTPPPGIWPPIRPEDGWRPLPPTVGGGPARPPVSPPQPGQPLPGEPPTVGGGPVLPPGMIWPPLPPDVHGKYLALVLVAGMPGGVKYRYVVVDADAKPPHRPGRPDQGLPGEGTPEPRR